jgi:hypothetical protein
MTEWMKLLDSFQNKFSPCVKIKKDTKGVSFSPIWETEEDLLETEHSRFFQEQIVKFMNFFTTPPIREIYEVLYKV